MKERALDSLAQAARWGVAAHAACVYGCPGCPVAAKETPALVVRIVGWTGDLVRTLAERPSAAYELASGVLPSASKDWEELARAGVGRAWTPFFVGGVTEAAADEDEVFAAHDGVVGRVGAARAALEALESARRAGLAPGLIVAADRSGGAGSTVAERVGTRLAWAHRLAVLIPADVGAPCIAPSPDYNSIR